MSVLRRNERPSNNTSCAYCGAALGPRAVRLVRVRGQRLYVHDYHPVQRGE